MALVDHAHGLVAAGPTLLTSRALPVLHSKRDEIVKGPVEMECKMSMEEKVGRAGGVEECEAVAAPCAEAFASELEPPKVVSEVAACMLADDCSSEDEEELSSTARLVMQAKAVDDEAFWTAAQRALHERERRERVGAFLKQYGFSSVHSKQGWWHYTFPLHVAAELGDAHLVQLILDSKAPRRRRDSSGQTARMLAKSVNRQGSHDAVIEVLKYSQSRRAKCKAPSQEVMSIELPASKVMSVELPALNASAAPERTTSNQPAATVFGQPIVEAMEAEGI